jgi:hypothetical protein
MTQKLDPDEKLRRKKARDRAYYLKNREHIIAGANSYTEIWRRNNPERARERTRRHRRKVKRQAIVAYGGKCACCGLDDYPFLSIDHINNDGAAHRKREKVGSGRIFAWLKKHNYPAGFQVLCFNCNLAKQHYGGECPHQTRLRGAPLLSDELPRNLSPRQLNHPEK